MADEITADHISEYLTSRDDFDLELSTYRTLREHGWRVRLGGIYPDPLQAKQRQYDVRAEKSIWPDLRCEMSLAVECKNLSTEFPVVISRVPCPLEESQHCVIRTWLRRETGDFSFEILESDPRRLQLCPVGSPVGKSLTQIRLDGKRLIASDSETYDKWLQAIASATELVELGAKRQAPDAAVFTFVMPVLVVADKTLWIVDYSDEGKRATPAQADEALYYVDRSHEIDHRYGKRTYLVRHLYVYTQTGFTRMLNNYNSATGRLAEATFGFAVRQSA